MKIFKKGKMEWEYLAAIVLVLVIVVVMLLFSQTMRSIVEEKAKLFVEGMKDKFFGA